MPEKIVIGLVGEIGAGKDTFCEYVKENYKNVFVLKFSDALTDVLKIFFDSAKREDQQWLVSLLRERFGGDILARALVKKVNSISEGMVILNGIRVEGDEKAVREIEGKIVYVTAEQKIIWERIRTRGEKADDNVSFEKFVELHKAASELEISSIGERADYKIENNGSKESFFHEIKKVIDSIQ